MTETEGPALTERQHYWLQHIQACEASGKTITDYAVAHGFAAAAMYAGKKKLIEKGALPKSKPARFQRAQLVDAAVNSGGWRVQLSNGVSVAFAGSVDAKLLSTVLSVAASAV